MALPDNLNIVYKFIPVQNLETRLQTASPEWVIILEGKDEDGNDILMEKSIRALALSKDFPEYKVLYDYLQSEGTIIPELKDKMASVTIHSESGRTMVSKDFPTYDQNVVQRIVNSVSTNPDFENALKLIPRQTTFPMTQEGYNAAETLLGEMQTIEPDKQFEIDSTSSGYVVKDVSGTPQEEARMLNPDEMAQRNLPPGTQWTISTSGKLDQYFPPKEDVLTSEQLLDQYIISGDLDKARDLQAAIRSITEEQITPERAAEMLVGISYSPSDFKAMMDAMLGEDSQLDTTVDIGALQEQASAMLRGEVPAAQTVSQMPPFEPPPVFPIPTPRPKTALGLEETSVDQAYNIPYIENLLFQQGEQDALMEEGLAPEVVSAPPEQAEPIFTPPEPNRGLPREVAAIGASAMASADRAAMERAAQDEEIRIIQNTPFTSTKEKLKAMEEVMGPRAALYMRNQRLLQPQQQQFIEASRPLTRRYV